MSVFDNFSDERVFDKVEFPKFTKYYIEDKSTIDSISKVLVWSHISPSGEKIEWFIGDNKSIYSTLKILENKSQKITMGNSYKFLDELADMNELSKDDVYFKFYKGNDIYKARLEMVYHYTPELIHAVFNIKK